MKDTAGFGWPTKPLGDLVDVLDRLRKPITKKNRKAGPYPYYGATGILDHVDGYLFDEPLVLIGEDGAKWEAGANSAFAIEGKTWVNNHAHVIRPHRDRVWDDWLIYYLNGADLMPFISGMTVPKLNQGRLREIPIPLPPLEEQQRIVAILDEAFEGLARARENAEANLENARELYRSGLTALTFRSVGTQEVALSEAVASDSSITYGVVKPGPEGEVPFVRGGDLRDGKINVDALRTITKEVSKTYQRTELRGGELLLCLVGQPGQTGVVPDSLVGANIARQTALIRLSQDFDAEFVSFFILSDEGQSRLGAYTQGAIQQVINLKELKTVLIPKLPLGVQQEISAECENLRSFTADIRKYYERKLTDIEDLRQSLLQKAFAGELT